MIINYIIYFCLLAVIIVFLIDLTAGFGLWAGRIHIGRIKDKKEWNKYITKIAAKWLSNTPKASISDNSRLIIIDMLKRNRKTDATHYWQKAALAAGCKEYLKNNESTVVEKSLRDLLTATYDDKGQWRIKPEYIDAAMLSYAVIKLTDKECDSYKPSLDLTWELIRKHIGENGTVKYRNTLDKVRFVDTIGLICPFLAAYGLRYNKTECLELAVNQIFEYEKRGMLPVHNIPCHAFNLESGIPLGIFGWGRGLGWYAIGLIDTWNELPEGNPFKVRLTESVRSFALSILKLQNKNGGWAWNISLNNVPTDSSVTAALGWFLINASKLPDISDMCKKGAENAAGYLMTVTRRNGIIDFSQGDTRGIGIYSQSFGILPFTQGFTVRLLNSLLP